MKRKKPRIKRRIYIKRRRPTNRNFDDPVYKEWRRKVYARDKYTCQYPGCGAKKNLHAHHIRKWAEYPLLRFDPNNGITLCYKCHKKVQNREDYFMAMFLNILRIQKL